MKPYKTDLAYKAILKLIQEGGYDRTKRLPSIKEIAKEIGFSTSPVRIAFKNLEKEGIISRPKGSKQGAGFYYEGGHIPNSKPVAFLFPEETMDGRLLSLSIRERLKPQGINLHVIEYSSNSKLEDICEFDEIRGIILYSSQLLSAETLNFLKNRKTPKVSIFGNPKDFHLGIQSDNFAGINMLITHLYQLGHRHIGYIDFDTDEFHSETLRKGFLSTLNQFGLEGKFFQIPPNGKDIEPSLQKISKELSNPRNVITALVCNGIKIIPIFLLYLERVKIIVPGDLSLASFGNCKEIEFYLKPFELKNITTIVPNHEEISEHACQLLKENSTSPQQIFVKPILQKGDSTLKK